MSGNGASFTPEPIIYLYSSHRRFNTISSITFGVSTSFSLQSLGEEIIMGIHSLGRDILGIFNASINRGAISSSLKPAMPHPMRVSRNRFRGCCLAYSKNLSIYGFIADRGPCIVGKLQNKAKEVKKKAQKKHLLFCKCLIFKLWALTDSNRRPSACKADALNQLS